MENLYSTPRKLASVKLVGEDGNAFAILGRCKKAARDAGVSAPEIQAFHAAATSGDYNNLLCTVMEWFDVDDDGDDNDDEDWS